MIIVLLMILITITANFKPDFIGEVPCSDLCTRHGAKVYGSPHTFAFKREWKTASQRCMIAVTRIFVNLGIMMEFRIDVSSKVATLGPRPAPRRESIWEVQYILPGCRREKSQTTVASSSLRR